MNSGLSAVGSRRSVRGVKCSLASGVCYGHSKRYTVVNTRQAALSTQP